MERKMKFDFDKIPERRGTGSLKWDVSEGELPMWVADMDFETAPAVREAIERRAAHGVFGYAITPDELFSSVADFWNKRYGAGFSSSDIVYVSGVVAAISSAVRKLTTAAENVLIQAPVYNIFYNSILNNGRKVLSSDLVYKDGKYEIDFRDLEEKMKNPETTLMILCNPHNPVGKIWSADELRKIASLAKANGVRVLSDEIHSPITRPGKSYVPFASVSPEAAEISVTALSASKAFNIAGLQSAFLAIKNPELRHKMWRAVNTDEVGEPNCFAVDANFAAFSEGAEWLDGLREYLFENRNAAERFISENMPRLHPVAADASYLMWVDISEYTDDSGRFCDELRQKTGLYISGGEQYGGGGRSFVRINLASSRENVLDGMARLLRFVKEYQ